MTEDNENTMKYKHDAAYLLCLAQENNSELILWIPKWRSINCEQHQFINCSSRPNSKHVHDLAAAFVHNKLHFGQENIQRSARAVIEKLLHHSHEYGCLTLLRWNRKK
jgi:hypothetical protein